MIDIDLSLLIFTTVFFLGLIYILNSILYKPLLGFIEDRNISIGKDEDSVQKNINDAKMYKDEIEKIILDARMEAHLMKQNALNLAKEDASKLIIAKKEQIESDYINFAQMLKTKKDELRNSLIEKIPEFKHSLNGRLSNI